MHDTARLGRITELLAEAKLLDLGFKVYHPTVDSGIDFYVDPGMVGIQVKGARLSGRNGGAQHGYVYRFKRSSDADVFIFYGYEDRAWFVVPRREMLGLGSSLMINRECKPNPRGRGRPSKTHVLHSYREAWHVLG